MEGLKVSLELSFIRDGQGGSKLKFVYAETVDRFKGPQLIPFKTPGMPLLVDKIVSAVASGKNGHAEGALGRDRSI